MMWNVFLSCEWKIVMENETFLRIFSLFNKTTKNGGNHKLERISFFIFMLYFGENITNLFLLYFLKKIGYTHIKQLIKRYITALYDIENYSFDS